MTQERRRSSNHEFMTFGRSACHSSHNLFCFSVINIVAYLLKARIVEPEKVPLLAKVTIFLCRQRPGKQVPAAKGTHATIEVLLEAMFSIRSVQTGYKEGNWGMSLD
jgi:hypothetical protein